MTGEYVKKKIENAGFQLNTVAELINVSPQNLHSKLKTKDVRVSLLLDLAKAINKSVYYFFEDSDDAYVELIKECNRKGNTIIKLQEEITTLKGRYMILD